MKTYLKITLLLLLLTSLSSRAQTDSTAMHRSLDALQHRASLGDPDARYRLSQILEEGKYLPADTLRALTLLSQAAHSGHTEAQNYLGFAFRHGLLHLPKDTDSAIYWLTRAATSPHPSPRAMHNIGYMLAMGEGGVKRDLDKARYWLERAGHAGVPDALSLLGSMEVMPMFTHTPDTLKALDYMERAALAFTSPALSLAVQTDMTFLLEALAQSMPEQEISALADRYYTEGLVKAATPLLTCIGESGHALSLARLAYLGSTVYRRTTPYDRVLLLYQTAALQGDPSAQYITAEMLDLNPDPDFFLTPAELYGKAAAAGITDGDKAIQRLKPGLRNPGH